MLSKTKVEKIPSICFSRKLFDIRHILKAQKQVLYFEQYVKHARVGRENSDSLPTVSRQVMFPFLFNFP